MGWILALVAGIMVAISLDELIPSAKALDDSNLPLLGVTAGMLVMAISLWMLVWIICEEHGVADARQALDHALALAPDNDALRAHLEVAGP